MQRISNAPWTDTQTFLSVLFTIGTLSRVSLLPCGTYMRPGLLATCDFLSQACRDRWTLPTSCEEVVNLLKFTGQEWRGKILWRDKEYMRKLCVLAFDTRRWVVAVKKDWIQLILVWPGRISRADPGKNCSCNKWSQRIAGVPGGFCLFVVEIFEQRHETICLILCESIVVMVWKVPAVFMIQPMKTKKKLNVYSLQVDGKTITKRKRVRVMSVKIRCPQSRWRRFRTNNRSEQNLEYYLALGRCFDNLYRR